MDRRYYHDMLGYKLRMTVQQAAIGPPELYRLETFTAARRANAAYLSKHIDTIHAAVPQVKPGFGHVWRQYTIRVPHSSTDLTGLTGAASRAAVRKLNDAGIGTGNFNPVPVHRQTYLQGSSLAQVKLPETERAAMQVLSLPAHPQLTQDDLDAIVTAVNKL